MFILFIITILFSSCAHQNYFRADKEVTTLSHSIARYPAAILQATPTTISQCYINPEETINKLAKEKEARYKDINYWITFSICQQNIKNYITSFKYLKKALSLSKRKKEKIVVYTNLLVLSLKTQNRYLANSYAYILQSLNPKNDLSLYNLALFAGKQQKYLQALRFINNISTNGQKDIDVKVLTAHILISLKRYQQAQKILQTIPQKYYQRSDIGIMLAYTFRHQKQYKQSLKYIENITIFKGKEKEIAERYRKLIEERLQPKNKKS